MEIFSEGIEKFWTALGKIIKQFGRLNYFSENWPHARVMAAGAFIEERKIQLSDEIAR